MAYLRNRKIDLTDPENQAAATQLQDWLVDVILPTTAFAEEPPFATGMNVCVAYVKTVI